MSIIVSNLIYDYPKVRALKNITLSIEKGTITALVGPNGAGKTTLMKCLAGLEKPFGGKIEINGIDVINKPRECHRMVGLLPDFFGLYNGLTAWQSLYFFAASSGISKNEISEVIETTAKRLWLLDKLNSKVEELSRGMRQRLAIAQILIKSPAILLLDEPASGLDPGARSELSDLFTQLKSEGITLLVSSHILSELEQYADRLIIMNDGKILPHSTSNDNKEERVSVTIKMLSSSEDALEIIKNHSKVKVMSIKGEEISIEINGGRADCYTVLKDAITNNCEIYEYKVEKADMQSEYMRVIQMCKGESNE